MMSTMRFLHAILSRANMISLSIGMSAGRADRAWIIAALLFLMTGQSLTASAQIVTSITSSGLSTAIHEPIGNVHGITGGTQIGSNLFHSFGEFSIAHGDIAQFQTHTLVSDVTLANILGRVTGGNPSNIFGTIDSATFYPSANLFLLNPSGIVFGPEATLNVGGAAHFATADYIRLSDGVMFQSTSGPHDSLLTAASIEAFGFLGSHPGSIEIQGSQLTMADHTGLSLIGGDVTIHTGAWLEAPSGDVRLASARSAGEFLLGDLSPMPNTGGTSFSAMGTIVLSEGAVVSASGDPGGTVRIRSGQLILDQAAISAHTMGMDDGAAAGIIVDATGQLTLDNQSALLALAGGSGRAGDIEINAGSVDVANGSYIYTLGFDTGAPGDIKVTATESISVRGTDEFGNPSEILSDAFWMSSTGSISLQAPLVSLSEMGAVETRMFGFGDDIRAGDITIEATRLDMAGGGMIRTVSVDSAPTGNISITATESVTLLGTNSFFEGTNISNENISGGTGTISIHTGSLALTDQARINSVTWFDADPSAASTPKIYIDATSSISLTTGSRIDAGGFFSDTGGLQISTQEMSLSGASAITTLSSATGASGSIDLTVRNLTLAEGSQILSSSVSGVGQGGDITVTATESVLLTGHGDDAFGGTLLSGIRSNTVAQFEDPSFTGSAGNITITAQTIAVSDGARIDSSSTGYAFGNAGDITLNAATVALDGGTISNLTEFAGNAGTITIKADQLSVTNQGQITSSAAARIEPYFDGEVVPSPTGDAGTITVTGLRSPAQSILIDGPGSGILTETSGSGSGGNISTLSDQLHLTNGATISAKTTADGDAGHILIQATDLTISGGATITAASTGSGNAGTVTIQGTNSPAHSVLISGFDSGVFSTTSGTGAGGSIFINANSVTLQNGGTLSAATSGTEATATGGTITVHADHVGLQSGAVITSSTSGAGDAGTVVLSANESISLSNSTIASNSDPESVTAITGNGGHLILSAPSITLQHGSALLAQTTGEGNAGSITLHHNHLSLTDMSVVQTSTQHMGEAGNITVLGLEGSVNTAHSVSLTGGSSLSSNSLGNDEGQGGAAGNIVVETQRLDVSEGSQISTSSIFSPGDAGTITVIAGEEVLLSQGILTSRSESNIPDEFVNEYVIGNAGSITVSAPSVKLTNESVIASTTDSRYTGDPSKGNAGSVTVNTMNLHVIEGSQLTSSSVIGDSHLPPTGNAGSVVVQGTGPTASIFIDGPGSGIFTDTQGTGLGGNITLNAHTVTLQNGGTLSAATSGTASTATGGSVTLNATNQVTMTGGASITASSTGPADAGDLVINAGQQLVMRDSSITTESEQASGGNIDIQAIDLVHLVNSTISASVQGGPTTSGGNITIDPNAVILQNSQILAQAIQGAGGNITIFTPLFLADTNSVVSASSQFGLSGTVTIQNPISNLAETVASLPSSLRQVQALQTGRCAALANSQSSSLLIAGRDSLPAEPGGWLPSPLALSETALTPLGTLPAAESPVTVALADETLSLRRLTPAGFLTQHFAESGSTGCHS
jgi:filamentous hemagglutinin family protein